MVRVKIYKNFNIKKQHHNAIILIGNFDGLHLGHQKLFNEALRYKKKFKLNLGVVTFDPIPKMFFNKEIKNYRISNFNQKIKYFDKYKVDFIINKKFDKTFSKIECNSFIKKYLHKKLKSKFLFVSNNFKFGYKRKGNVILLKKFQKKFNYNLIKPKPLIKKNKIVSSTLIRNYLESGKIEIANKFLSRKWSVEGKVEKGRMLGRKIGFPTCNIDIKNYVIAKPGVYSVNVKIDKSKKIFKGIANLGFRPTFNQKKILLEVNLFNFSGNLYNKKLSVDFKKFIRGEKKFKNINQLKKQINKDILSAKK
ncbi:bifunctional riboflavin kinase/FAD synthetase [Candidatus Pelagibacter sp.]|nr:bifunctional riboflavin kinase/FAD synthetase [Candidatus Pelagibacter sp.]